MQDYQVYYRPSPGKITLKKWKNCTKVNKNCAQVACTIHGCSVQIWPGFCLGKIYNNTKVVSGVLNYSISLDEFVFRRMYFVSTTSKFQNASC